MVKSTRNSVKCKLDVQLEEGQSGATSSAAVAKVNKQSKEKYQGV